jgi:hypothetical protein
MARRRMTVPFRSEAVSVSSRAGDARSGGRQRGDRGIDQVLGDTGSLDKHGAGAVQCAGQRNGPQVLNEQYDRRGARAEVLADEAAVLRPDQAADLAVEVEEGRQAADLVELGGEDLAGAALSDDDRIEDADDLLVDEGG